MSAATQLRSMLFVPADSERKLAKSHGQPGRRADPRPRGLGRRGAQGGGARHGRRLHHRARVATSSARLYVRINPLDSGLAMGDLAAVVVPGLAGIMLPKTRSAADIVHLGHCLDALEARAGIAAGTVQDRAGRHRDAAGDPQRCRASPAAIAAPGRA